MTFALSNTPNNELHAHYATLCQLEQAAGERADALEAEGSADFAEAYELWGREADRLIDVRDVYRSAPVTCVDDIKAKLSILEHDAANTDDARPLIATLNEQVAAWLRRRG
jgi:hypothetical protein